MDASISHMLRDARGRLRLTLPQLADRVGIPASTLRAYERGSRVPGRDRLIRITDALEFSRSEQNIVLEATGYAQNFDSSNPALRPTWYQLGDLQGVVNRVPWPTFIGNELSELVVANDGFQALVGVDLREEFTEVWERNLMMIASNPRFADRIVNWDALAGVLIANAKGSHYFPQTLDAPSPYFARVLEEFARGEPRYVKRFAQLWDETPLVENHQRWEYPVIWEDAEYGRLEMLGVIVSSDHTQTMINFHDWIPTNADTWTRLDLIKSRWRHRPRSIQSHAKSAEPHA